jgi:6-phosphogluconolactonase
MEHPDRTMPEAATAVRWHVLDDPQAVAEQTAQHILTAAARAIAERGVFRIVLAGGRTPEAAYRLLVGADTDWSRWEIYFGDERCLPVDDEQRNSYMAAQAWLDHVAIAETHIHPIPAEQGAEAAAQTYAVQVQAATPFDMVLLGMGEDGHTASLFPGQQHPAEELVHAVHNAPKPPPDRVSLSQRVLSDARQALILVTGNGKRDAVKTWKAGDILPVASIRGHTGVDVLIDSDAAG